jgi:serum/glucocorticoid-regulated kinase 2
MEPVINDGEDHDQQTDTDAERGEQTDTDRTDGDGSNTTASQSRSSSMAPAQEPDVDVFDGYSFKGRHSIILDGEEEGEGGEGEGDEGEEEGKEEEVKKEAKEQVKEKVKVEVKEEEMEQEEIEEGEPEDILCQEIALEPPELDKASADDTLNEETVETTTSEVAESSEHKTPEARPTSLPETGPEDMNDVTVEDLPPSPPSKDIPPEVTEVETEEEEAPPLPPKAQRPNNARAVRSRREKSGIPALDRYLSDTIDEDEAVTEREEDEDDWDLVEAGLGEDRNGARGTSLFARGVVDKYRLAVVFRKASSPSYRPAPRSFSAMSKDSTATDRDLPSPESRRRGRLLRKSPREFLQPKSPKKSGPKSPPATPSSSLPTTSEIPHSLKTKESAISVGFSSDNSANGELDSSGQMDTIRVPRPQEDHPKHKTKKLQRYREGAEKMLSLFASPRQS